MLYPSIFGENLFDDFFDFPSFREVDNAGRQLYGKNAARLMRTDVREHDGEYEVDIDLPGFKKDEISLELKEGYLIVSANKDLDKDEKDKKGKLIRQERYYGSMQRSFYVGKYITETDIKASFKHGVLNLLLPKKEKEKLPEKKQILIEG